MQLEKVSIELIKIGFPTRYYDEIKGEGTLCVCHNEKRFINLIYDMIFIKFL